MRPVVHMFGPEPGMEGAKAKARENDVYHVDGGRAYVFKNGDWKLIPYAHEVIEGAKTITVSKIEPEETPVAPPLETPEAPVEEEPAPAPKKKRAKKA